MFALFCGVSFMSFSLVFFCCTHTTLCHEAVLTVHFFVVRASYPVVRVQLPCPLLHKRFVSVHAAAVL